MPYLLVLLLGAFAQTTLVGPLVDRIDQTFSKMNDFSAEFEQIFQGPSNPKHTLRGLLYLKKGRKIRFDYKSPEEAQFVSNGSTIWDYVPGRGVVEKSKVKQSDDARVPMMFLLGQKRLGQEFSPIENLGTTPAGFVVLRLFPKAKGQPVVTIDVDPKTAWIWRLVIEDRAVNERTEYVFKNIKVNSGLDSKLFDFTPPSGVSVVEAR
jgi:outer membrane lipoprotein carrier protein